MLASQWINKAQVAGWLVKSSRNGILRLSCSCQGCNGALSLPLSNLGPIPEPCDKPHVGRYGQQAYEQYTDLVDDLRQRRRALGLSQEDINAAAGFTDGHLNKLEALDRTAQFPTLQLWAQAVGLKITTEAAPLPPATARALERRPAPLRETLTQKALFND